MIGLFCIDITSFDSHGKKTDIASAEDAGKKNNNDMLDTSLIESILFSMVLSLKNNIKIDSQLHAIQEKENAPNIGFFTLSTAVALIAENNSLKKSSMVIISSKLCVRMIIGNNMFLYIKKCPRKAG
ncbi:hypothetical protein [Serratia sp. CY37869]|uniref:hypothetical protein n=1 Tax=Serratia sp. CY37869 TaxID=3383612 RepID=UPI003FA11842